MIVGYEIMIDNDIVIIIEIFFNYTKKEKASAQYLLWATIKLIYIRSWKVENPTL